MTIKINELIIKAKVEKKQDVASSSNSQAPKEQVVMKESAELLSINKINRER